MAKRKYTAEQYVKSQRGYFDNDEEFKKALEEGIEDLTNPNKPKENKYQIDFFKEVQALL